MARLKRPAKMSRLNLAVTHEVRLKLESIQRDLSAGSLEEVVRRSVNLLDIVLRVLKEKKSKLFFRTREGDITEVLIVP